MKAASVKAAATNQDCHLSNHGTKAHTLQLHLDLLHRNHPERPNGPSHKHTGRLQISLSLLGACFCGHV